MRQVGVVREHEGFDLLGSDAGIGEVRSAKAFATQYRKPDLNKRQPHACTGKKWNTKVRSGWAASQACTSADQCELNGYRIRWISWPIGACWSSNASSSQ